MLEAKKFSSIRQLKGISERTMTEHFKLYEGYVKKFNELEGIIAKADRTVASQIASQFREAKVEQTFALGGVKNHENYFDVLGGKGGQPDSKTMALIEKDFGSFKNFVTEFTAVAMASRGWAFLVYDFDLKKLMLYASDSQNTYLVWNCELIIALDVYEHAYYLDYATKRAEYLQAFFDNLDWVKVGKHLALFAKG